MGMARVTQFQGGIFHANQVLDITAAQPRISVLKRSTSVPQRASKCRAAVYQQPGLGCLLQQLFYHNEIQPPPVLETRG